MVYFNLSTNSYNVCYTFVVKLWRNLYIFCISVNILSEAFSCVFTDYLKIKLSGCIRSVLKPVFLIWPITVQLNYFQFFCCDEIAFCLCLSLDTFLKVEFLGQRAYTFSLWIILPNVCTTYTPTHSIWGLIFPPPPQHWPSGSLNVFFPFVIEV